MMAALIIFLLQFPLAVSSKIYRAYREGRIENYWAMAGNVLSLLALLAVTHTHGGLLWLVIAICGTSLTVNLANTFWLFLWHKPFLRPRFQSIKISAMQSLVDLGGKFFLIQVLALLTFETDNLVISHYIGAAHVPEYSLTYRVFEYALLPQSLLFTYLWNAYNEAIARKDIAWVKRTFRLTLTAGMGFSTVAALGLTFIAKPFIGWWAGPAVEPNFSLIGWIVAWSLINAFTNPIACLLAAASHLRAQVIYSTVATATNIFLSIYLAQRWGVDGVIAATVISYAFFICIPAYIDANRLLKRLGHAV
jgi:O-antigen/teichoic acid export membrane protein